MSESYPADSTASTPSLPVLPSPPPERWQFSLATILLFTLACAVAAALARFWRFGPAVQLVSLALSVVFLLYLFWRLRTVILRWGRWHELQQHRRELVEWADRTRATRHADGGQQPDPSERDAV